MKAIKYLVAGVLALSMSAPAMAQDVKSQVDAITKVVIDAKGDVNATKSQVKAFTKMNKKNAAALAGLGRAFLRAKNYDQAHLYADMAIKANKNLSDGYILHGDACAAQDDGGAAASWYEQATYYDKQNPEGYVKYARVYQKVDPDGAVAMLEKLRQVKPDYPVDAAAGYMYSSNSLLKTAIDYYDKVSDVTKMEDYILYDYASTAYVLEQYDKAVNLASQGIRKYPKYVSFNRVGLYGSDKLKKYDEAVVYGEKLFNTVDTLKYTANDYTYYADALSNVGRYDDAIAALKHISEVDADNKNADKLISDVYVKAKQFDKAVASYNVYLNAIGDAATYKDYDALADIYIDENIAATDKETKVAALKNADKVYGTIAEKYDYARTYAVWKRALLNHQINPDVKEGQALPFYQQYISLLENKADRTASESNKLATAYQYLAVHYIQNDRVAEAKNFAGKLLQLRPEDETAKQIISLK